MVRYEVDRSNNLESAIHDHLMLTSGPKIAIHLSGCSPITGFCVVLGSRAGSRAGSGAG
jgi:hypothetical protein